MCCGYKEVGFDHQLIEIQNFKKFQKIFQNP